MPQSEDFYKTFRYLLGVGEGPELVNQLPFNTNADFTDSIKLNKGCYLGQELCARTYYTGVIRKRLMTVIISDSPENLKKLIDPKDQRLPAADHDQKLARLDFIDSNFLQDMDPQEKSDIFRDKTIKNSLGRKAFKIISTEKNIGLVIGDYFSAPDSFKDEIYSDGKYFYK
jgi:folate-binding protein YgfZ